MWTLFLPCVASTIEFTGEALYWRGLGVGTDVAILETTPDLREVRNVKPSYNWGVAVRGCATPPGDFYAVQVGALYVRSDSHLRTAGASTLDPAIDFSVLRASLALRYYTVYARGKLPYICGRSGSLGLYAGGCYVNLLHKQQVIGTLADGEQLEGLQEARFRGGGPQVGLEGAFIIAGSLRATGSLGLAALIGQQSHEIFGLLYGASQPVQFLQLTVGVPALSSRLGLQISGGCLLCWSAEVGYQLDSYWSTFLLFVGNSIATRNRTPANFGFAGPYGSLSLGF